MLLLISPHHKVRDQCSSLKGDTYCCKLKNDKLIKMFQFDDDLMPISDLIDGKEFDYKIKQQMIDVLI